MDWLLNDRDRQLLPTPWLSDRRFEDFVERLLKAQPLLGSQVRHVAEVFRWGVPGDKQDGIDLYGRFNDGVPAAWQCKHLRTLTAAKVRKAVNELTFQHADEIYLVYADVAKVAARNEIQKYPSWRLWDRRDLTTMLQTLPAQDQRDILHEFWGPDVRRLFVEGPEDAFVSLETFTKMRLNPNAVMNDLGPLAGRTDELNTMRAVFNRASNGFRPVVVVTGPGGRGKSRLLTDSLHELHEQQQSLPIICLAPGRVFSEAAMGELRVGPSVVVVDDAHAGAEALAPLLAFARSRDDIQVILATRPSRLRTITDHIIQAGFGPSEQTTVTVEELRKTDAERLVKGLTEGMGLSFELRSYLAGQAQHSPHVAVITTNLIKRGELTASLAVDNGLRQTVLARYRGLLAPDVDGFDGATSRKVLATYAAICPVSSDDRDLMQKIADFCDLTIVDLARIIQSLRDHGVLIAQGDLLWVVPDVVADSVLEEQAAHGEFDTGFASALWDAFGDSAHQHQLATSLGELDWRLSKRGGPTVMDPIWTTISERLLALPYYRLHEELDRFGRLAATQPNVLMNLLEQLRARLDEEERNNTPVPEDSGQRSWRQCLGLPPIGRDDVRRKLPELYARAAISEPELLETALDALWALRKRDARPPHSNTDHAQRMVDDRLGNLVKLPDPSFPERIVTRVSTWLAEPGAGETVATPLFALKPLLVKEQLDTFQSAPMTLSMNSKGINPAAMRGVRDQIRVILLDQALSNDLRRAGEAVRLLDDALMEPRGYFGEPVGSDVILAWEDDDLATVAALTEIGDRTTIPALRRLVRNALSWPAEHATSPRVMHAALAGVANLDSIARLDDDLADSIFGNRFALTKVDPAEVPSIEKLTTMRAAEHDRLKNQTAEQRQAEHEEKAWNRVQHRRELEDAAENELARRLVHLGPVAQVLNLVDRTARDVVNLRPEQYINLWPIWRRITEQETALLPEIVYGIASSHPGPLDRELPYLINLMLQHAPDKSTAWLRNAVVNGRTVVKIAIANGFGLHPWHDVDDLATIWATGSHDTDPEVADAFLGAAGSYLRAAPIEAVSVLLDKDISANAANRAIEGANEYDGTTYGSGLEREEAIAALTLIARAGYRSHTVQTTVSGIASRNPDLVLDHLAQQDDAGARLPEDIHELRAAFDRRSNDLATWIHRRLGPDEDEQRQLGRILEAATNQRLTEAQGNAFVALVSELDVVGLIALGNVLSYLDTWPLRHPSLATAMTERARQTNCYSEVRQTLRTKMHPSHWGGWNGESPELHKSLERARQATEKATDPALRSDFEDAVEHIQGTIDADRRRHQDDTASGWE